MKKRFYISIGVILLLILIWGGYKTFLLYMDSIADIDGMENLANISEIAITTNKNGQNTQVENMHLYIPEDFEESYIFTSNDENTKSYAILGEGKENYTSVIFVGFTKDAIKYTMENNLSFLNDIDYQKLMEKYNANNEIDLIKYYEKNIDNKRNIFWSKSHLEYDYFVKQYIGISMTIMKNSAYLTNDLNGFVTYNSGYYFIKLVNEDDIYYLTLWSRDNSFTYDDVIKILETISFD
jgi:hypothetical protein